MEERVIIKQGDRLMGETRPACPMCGKILLDARGLAGHLFHSHDVKKEDIPKMVKECMKPVKESKLVAELLEEQEKLKRVETGLDGFDEIELALGNDPNKEHVYEALKAEKKRVEQRIKKISEKIKDIRQPDSSSEEDNVPAEVDIDETNTD